MSAATSYLEVLTERFAELSRTTGEAIETCAQRVAGSVADGGVLHVFGSGHSQLVAMEAAGRAAGLAAVHPIVDPALSPTNGRRAAATERLADYGRIVMETEDLRPGEVLVVVSNSGINPVPIDVALGAGERGLFVVAVTSRAQSLGATARHGSGRRLMDVADLTIDTGAPLGDGASELSDGTLVGPLSTILSAAVLHAVGSRVAELLLTTSTGSEPVLISQNLDVDADVNDELYARYADRRTL